MNGIWQDLRYALRMLSKHRTFTAIAILILALGIGANSAIYSIVYNVLIKQLPYPDAERLITVWQTNKKEGSDRGPVSATDIADYRARNHVFEDISVIDEWRPILTAPGSEAERVPSLQVGDGYFRVMKAEPMLGRVFRPEEQIEGKDFVAVLSYGIWRTRFGSDKNIVGKTIQLNFRTYIVVGVLEPEAQSLPDSLTGGNVQIYRPVAEPYDNQQRGSRHLYAVARLKRGVTLTKAQAEMSSIADQLAKQYPDDNTDRGIRLATITEDTVGKIRSSLLLLIGAAGIVLLIACANLANLLLARGLSRNQEIAVRTSLGAPQWRLIRQFLAENAILTFLGAGIGLLLAHWGIVAIRSFGMDVIPRIELVRLNPPVLIFAFLITIIAGLLFSLVPAIKVTRMDLNAQLRDGGRTGTTGRQHRILRDTLVAAEIALALLLLTGAGLLIQTVQHLYHVNPGFEPSNVLTMNVWLPAAKYKEGEQRSQFFAEIVQRIEHIPGVEAAATTTVLPLSGGYDGRTVSVEGQPHTAAEEPNADMYVTTPDYFKAMKIALVRGNFYTLQHTEKSQLVALVNETMAKTLWKGDDPIGKRIRLFTGPNQTTPWRTVIGVVKDVKNYGLDTIPPMQFYLPEAQFHSYFVSLVIRHRNIPLRTLADESRKSILSVDSQMPVFRIATMNELLNNSIAVRRLSMALFGGFAFLALCLAVAGIYGVVSYVTAQRTTEIGIRMTLGAAKRDVVQLILRDGMMPALLGTLAGISASIMLTRFLTKLLFEVEPLDSTTFLVVSLIIILTAGIACYIPARRASQTDPLSSLRYE